MDEGDLQAGLVDHREQGADGELQHRHEERQAGEVEAGVEEGEAAREGPEGRGGQERHPARAEIGADHHPDGERRVEQAAGDREDGQADDDRRGLHEHREGRAEDERAHWSGKRVAPGEDLGCLRQREEGRADQAERQEDQAKVEDRLAVGAPVARAHQRPETAKGDEDWAEPRELIGDEPGGDRRADVGADHDRPGLAHRHHLLLGQSHRDEVHYRRRLHQRGADGSGQRTDETILRGLTQAAAQAFAAELGHLAGEIPQTVQVEHDRRDGGEEEIHGRRDRGGRMEYRVWSARGGGSTTCCPKCESIRAMMCIECIEAGIQAEQRETGNRLIGCGS